MSSPSAIYQRAHKNVVQQRGHASEHFCRGFMEPCGRSAQEWAFEDRTGESFSVTMTVKKDGKWYTTTRLTSFNPIDFEPMCKKHHKKMDNWTKRNWPDECASSTSIC